MLTRRASIASSSGPWATLHDVDDDDDDDNDVDAADCDDDEAGSFHVVARVGSRNTASNTSPPGPIYVWPGVKAWVSPA